MKVRSGRRGLLHHSLILTADNGCVYRRSETHLLLIHLRTALRWWNTYLFPSGRRVLSYAPVDVIAAQRI